MTEQEIRDTFRYHAPDERQMKVFEDNRFEMTETAVRISKTLPMCRERSLYITLMQQAQMMANAAVAIHGHPEEKQHEQLFRIAETSVEELESEELESESQGRTSPMLDRTDRHDPNRGT